MIVEIYVLGCLIPCLMEEILVHPIRPTYLLLRSICILLCLRFNFKGLIIQGLNLMQIIIELGFFLTCYM